MEEIKKQIKKYMLQGYSVNEVVSMIDAKGQAEFTCDVDKVYRLVTKTFETVRFEMSPEEKEALKVLRKKHADDLRYEKIKKIADKVKEIAENSKQSYGSLKDALAYAVQAVARTESLTKDSVRNYTRTIYPDFYDYYNQNLDITPNQLVAMAELIIKKSMYRSMAEKMQHYTKMTQYLAANRPDLLEQIQSVYASHTGNFNNEPYSASQKTFENFTYLERIICEFRPSMNLLLEFINRAGIFTKEQICSLEELAKLLYAEKQSIYIHGIPWYITESAIPDDFTDYRNARFQAFANQFFAFETIEEKLRYVDAATFIDLKSVKEKIALQAYSGGKYGFTLDDNRQIVRWCYNYALTRLDLERALFGKHVKKHDIIARVATSDDLYDKMLVDGARRLNEHYKDIEISNRIGRNS